MNMFFILTSTSLLNIYVTLINYTLYTNPLGKLKAIFLNANSRVFIITLRVPMGVAHPPTCVIYPRPTLRGPNSPRGSVVFQVHSETRFLSPLRELIEPPAGT